MDWFRYHTNALDNRKIQTMPERMVRVWLNFMCLNRIYNDRLPEIAEMAFRLRCTEKQAEAWRSQLVALKLVDRLDDGTFTMHDWDDWQFSSDDSAARKRRQRQRQRTGQNCDIGRDVSRDNPRDCPTLEQSRADTEQSRAETDTEQNAACAPDPPVPINARTQPRAADLDGPLSVRFPDFWERYPRKQRKDAAAQAWVSVVTPSNETAVFACLDRYLASDEVTRGVVANPDKWLYEQQRNEWTGDWPRARERPGERRAFVSRKPSEPTKAEEVDAMRALIESPDEPEEMKAVWKQRLAEMGGLDVCS